MRGKGKEKERKGRKDPEGKRIKGKGGVKKKEKNWNGREPKEKKVLRIKGRELGKGTAG